MDNTTFRELLGAGNITALLADGGASLTQKQMEEVRNVARGQSKDELRTRQFGVAQQAGWAQSQLNGGPKPNAGFSDYGQGLKNMPAAMAGGMKSKKNQDQELGGVSGQDPKVTKISPGVVKNLKVNDTEADVLAKLYNFMRHREEEMKRRTKDSKKHRRELSEANDYKNKQLLSALKGERLKSPIKKRGLLKTGLMLGAAAAGLLASQNAIASIKLPDVTGRIPDITEPRNNTPAENTARDNAEAYLGRPMTNKEWDLLLRGTGAESGTDPKEQALVMGSILNRARRNSQTVEEVLNAPGQFEAVTGDPAKGTGPSKTFIQGPGKRLPSILKSSDMLKQVPKDQINFQAANPKAYATEKVGKEKIKKKMEEGYVRVGESIFNKGMAPEPVQAAPVPKKEPAPNESKPSLPQKDAMWNNIVEHWDNTKTEMAMANRVTNVFAGSTTYYVSANKENTTPPMMDKQFYTYG